MLLSGLAGIAVWTRIPPQVRALVILLFITFIITYSAGHFSNNGWLFNFYIPVEFCMISWGATAYLSSFFTKRILPLFAILYFCIWIGSLIFFGIKQFSYPAYLSGCIMLSVTYLSVLFQITLSGTIKYRKEIFLLCFAILLYYACIVPLFGMLNYLNRRNSEVALGLYSTINWGLGITSNVLIGIYFLSHFRKE